MSLPFFSCRTFLFSPFQRVLAERAIHGKGCQEYLTKTVNFDILEQIVREFRIEDELISSLILE
jgi:hypothetical protein